MGEISKKLGLRIKELREKQGYTQLKLAEILNMEASNLSKIEKKKISKEIKSLEVPNLYLTPKEIDLELNELSKVISKILNKILN